VELIDHLWRDLDRLARAGAKPIDVLIDPGTWVVLTYRLGRAMRRLPRILRLPATYAHKPFELLVGTLARVVLPSSSEVGGGLRLGRVGGIRIAADAYIGRDCDLGEGVTIASSGGAPWIGDRVRIGPGAKLVGPIRVGNDAAIGPNAVVESDVPDGATASGVPARVVAGTGSRGLLVPGRKRPPLTDALRSLVRDFLPRPTQLLLRS
jgi:serine O-acetyltransferase